MCSIAISCIRDAHERQAKQMLEERNEKKERSSSVNQIKQPKCSGNYTNLSTFGARKLIVAAQHVCLYKRKRRRRRRSISYKTHIQLLYFNQCIHRYIYIFASCFGIVFLPTMNRRRNRRWLLSICRLHLCPAEWRVWKKGRTSTFGYLFIKSTTTKCSI